MILIMVDENAKMAGKGEKYRPMGSEFAKTAKELADYLCDNYHYPNARCQSSQGQNQRNTAVNNHRR